MQVKAIEPVGRIKTGEIFNVIEIIDQVYLLEQTGYFSQKHFQEVTHGTTVEIIGTPGIEQSTNCNQDVINPSDCHCD